MTPNTLLWPILLPAAAAVATFLVPTRVKWVREAIGLAASAVLVYLAFALFAVKNLEFRLGDLEDPPIDSESVDLVILSQALHHAKDPPRAIRSAHRILRPGMIFRPTAAATCLVWNLVCVYWEALIKMTSRQKMPIYYSRV